MSCRPGASRRTWLNRQLRPHRGDRVRNPVGHGGGHDGRTGQTHDQQQHRDLSRPSAPIYDSSFCTVSVSFAAMPAVMANRIACSTVMSRRRTSVRCTMIVNPPIAKENVEEENDAGFGMVRIEVLCKRCDAHIGHVFDDGPRPTGLRYCMNSAAMRFVKAV